MSTLDETTADQLRALVAAAAPAIVASPGTADAVLAAARRGSRSRRRRGLAAAGAITVAVAVAAAGWTSGGDHRKWTQPSGAMEPTVAVGQTVILAADIAPQRGDVVLLTASDGGQSWESLGRVIGLPLDTVSCPAEPDGTCRGVVVSGVRIDEPWITTPTAPFPPVTVGAGQLFFLGDKRDQANDSRFIGPQALSGVVGVAVARIAADGTREPLPGTPPHDVPGDGSPVDPADPVPPARVVTPG